MSADIFSDLSRATDADDQPLPGAQWFFYDTGTTTPRNVYSNASLTTSLGAVVTADSGGQFVPIFFNAAFAYKAVLKTAGGSTVKTIDPCNAGVNALLSDLASTAAGKGADLIGYDGGTTVGAELDTLNSIITNDIEPQLSRFVNVIDFGADPTGTNDSYAAIMAAINSATHSHGSALYPSGPAIYFPNGVYRCDTTIQLKKSVRLYGNGSGLLYDSVAQLVFPAGTTGILIHAYNTINNTTEGTPTTSGSASIIEGLRIIGGRGTADAYGGHGIRMRGMAEIRNCMVYNFEGNGYHIYAGAGFGGAIEGNCNLWRLRGCFALTNKGHGFYVEGADANAGGALYCNAIDNDGWGFWDNSFLGNGYEFCHTESNALGAYKSIGANARTTFIQCYSEGGQPESEFLLPTMVLGGLHGAGITSTSTYAGFVDQHAKYLRFTDAGYGANGGYIEMAADQDAFLKIQDNNESSGNYPWTMRMGTGSTYFSYGGTGSRHIELTNTDATVANGFPREVATAMGGPGLAFRSGFMFGSTMTRLSIAFGAMPASGTYQAGDYAWNVSPSVAGGAGSQYVIQGWMRLTTGSAHVLNTDWVECRCRTGT